MTSKSTKALVMISLVVALMTGQASSHCIPYTRMYNYWTACVGTKEQAESGDLASYTRTICDDSWEYIRFQPYWANQCGNWTFNLQIFDSPKGAYMDVNNETGEFSLTVDPSEFEHGDTGARIQGWLHAKASNYWGGQVSRLFEVHFNERDDFDTCMAQNDNKTCAHQTPANCSESDWPECPAPVDPSGGNNSSDPTNNSSDANKTDDSRKEKLIPHIEDDYNYFNFHDNFAPCKDIVPIIYRDAQCLTKDDSETVKAFENYSKHAITTQNYCLRTTLGDDLSSFQIACNATHLRHRLFSGDEECEDKSKSQDVHTIFGACQQMTDHDGTTHYVRISGQPDYSTILNKGPSAAEKKDDEQSGARFISAAALVGTAFTFLAINM